LTYQELNRSGRAKDLQAAKGERKGSIFFEGLKDEENLQEMKIKMDHDQGNKDRIETCNNWLKYVYISLTFKYKYQYQYINIYICTIKL